MHSFFYTHSLSQRTRHAETKDLHAHLDTMRPSGMSSFPLANSRGAVPCCTANSSASERSCRMRSGRTNMTSLTARRQRQLPASSHEVTGKRPTAVASFHCCHRFDVMRSDGRVRDVQRWTVGGREASVLRSVGSRACGSRLHLASRTGSSHLVRGEEWQTHEVRLLILLRAHTSV